MRELVFVRQSPSDNIPEQIIMNTTNLTKAVRNIVIATDKADAAYRAAAEAFVADGCNSLEKEADGFAIFTNLFYAAWAAKQGAPTKALESALAAKGAAWKKHAAHNDAAIAALRLEGMKARDSAAQKLRGHFKAVKLGLTYAELQRIEAAEKAASAPKAPKGAQTPASAKGAANRNAASSTAATKKMTLQQAWDVLSAAMSKNAPEQFELMQEIADILKLKNSTPAK
jgi:hypothetical protein